MLRTIAFVVTIFLLAASGQLHGAEFKSASECVVGAKVQNRQNQTGTVISVSGGMCKFELADGKKVSTLFWMLRAAGSTVESGNKLVPGTYPCYSLAGTTLNYMFMDIIIDNADSYRDKQGKKGKYLVDTASGKLVFESGPFKTATAKVMAGPRIGLNMNGGSFFNTTCSLKK